MYSATKSVILLTGIVAGMRCRSRAMRCKKRLDRLQPTQQVVPLVARAQETPRTIPKSQVQVPATTETPSRIVMRQHGQRMIAQQARDWYVLRCWHSTIDTTTKNACRMRCYLSAVSSHTSSAQMQTRIKTMRTPRNNT